MIVLSGALVLVALVLLVFGALDRNLPYVYASIGVSVLSLLLLMVGILQRRGDLSGEDEDGATTPVTDTSAERVPVGGDRERTGAGPADHEALTAELAAPAAAPAPVEEPARPASRRVVADDADVLPEEPVAELRDDGQFDDDFDDDGDHHVEDPDVEDPDVEDPDVEDSDEDEELEAEDVDEDVDEDLDEEEPEDEGSGVTVLVVSGRPRYHLEGCRVLRGKEPQPLDRDDARHHGFTPCGVCKPDADEAAVPDQPADDGRSLPDALFGEPLSADRPEAGDEPAAPPDRPVQPVLPEVEPATGSGRRGRPASELSVPADDVATPTPLQGEDPADDPTLAADADATAEPSPDVAANPDEPVEADHPTSDEAGPGAVAQEPVGDAAAPDEPEVDEPEVDEPEVEPVAAEDVPIAAPPAVDAEPATEVQDPAEAVRPGRTSRGPARPPVDVAEEPAPESGPAKRASAKKAPAKKAPAKKAPARKAPARKTPVEQAPAAPAPEPQPERPVVRTVRADPQRLGSPSAGRTTTRVSARGAAPATGARVVVVPDRDRFHRPECRFARAVAGATTLPKASASRQGYAACGVCKP